MPAFTRYSVQAKCYIKAWKNKLTLNVCIKTLTPVVREMDINTYLVDYWWIGSGKMSTHESVSIKSCSVAWTASMIDCKTDVSPHPSNAFMRASSTHISKEFS